MSARASGIRNQAFVDVPKSPHPLSTYSSRPSSLTSTQTRNLKENTPLRRVFGEMTPSEQTPTVKRKLSESSMDDSTFKKQKTISIQSFQVQRLAFGPESLGSNPCPEFPNGNVYCHQCSQRRDVLDSAHCDQVTLRYYKSRDPTEKPCKAKYCGKCLKNRYGEDLQQDIDAKTPYFFKCPRCRGICSCRSCMKSKGLEPVGKPVNNQSVQKASSQPVEPPEISTPSRIRFKEPEFKPKPVKEAKSVLSLAQASRDVEMKDVADSTKTKNKDAPKKVSDAPKASGSSSAKSSGKPVVEITKVGKSPKSGTIQSATASSNAEKVTAEDQEVKVSAPRGRPKKPPKPSVPLKARWTAISTSLSLSDAQTRFQIREFVLRFASLMEPSIPISLLQELDDTTGCKLNYQGDMPNWVSEACVRAIVLGLLSLLAREEDLESVKHVQIAVRDIRTGGVNLNKVWSILESLRITLGKDHDLDLDEDWLPDPLPPPKVTSAYSTRATRSTPGLQSAVNVIHPGQMIPVVEALVEAAIRADVVRDAFEESVANGKTLGKYMKDCVKLDVERWNAEREKIKAKGTKSKDGKEKDKVVQKEIKTKREHHKRFVEAMENSFKVASPNFAPRFSPLGTDHESRTYWISSPGARERKSAMDFLNSLNSSGVGDVKPKGRIIKGVTISKEESAKMNDWGWCIVVWGKPPVDSIPVLPEEHSDEELDSGETRMKEPNEDTWWGLYEPGEIKRVADWADWNAGVNMEQGDEETALAKALREYAGLLEWRLKEDKYDEEAWGKE